VLGEKRSIYGSRQEPAISPAAREGNQVARRKTGNVDRETIRLIIRMSSGPKPMSTREIADELNRREIPTARGGRWHSATVAGVIRRERPAE